MNGIVLKDSINLFGFKQGFSFWFRWSFSDPIKMFYIKYILGGPVCTYHGYFGCHNECTHEKIFGRRNIWKYQKQRNKEIDAQIKTIHGSDTGICTYCGAEKGTKIIDDPNGNTLERWLVCESCTEVINIQRELSFPLISLERQQELIERLLEISKETGKPIMNVCIEKIKGGKYHASSITFTGEK